MKININEYIKNLSKKDSNISSGEFITGNNLLQFFKSTQNQKCLKPKSENITLL